MHTINEEDYRLFCEFKEQRALLKERERQREEHRKERLKHQEDALATLRKQPHVCGVRIKYRSHEEIHMPLDFAEARLADGYDLDATYSALMEPRDCRNLLKLIEMKQQGFRISEEALNKSIELFKMDHANLIDELQHEITQLQTDAAKDIDTINKRLDSDVAAIKEKINREIKRFEESLLKLNQE